VIFAKEVRAKDGRVGRIINVSSEERERAVGLTAMSDGVVKTMSPALNLGACKGLAWLMRPDWLRGSLRLSS
jgi:hypothetical protein